MLGTVGGGLIGAGVGAAVGLYKYGYKSIGASEKPSFLKTVGGEMLITGAKGAGIGFAVDTLGVGAAAGIGAAASVAHRWPDIEAVAQKAYRESGLEREHSRRF